LRRAERRRSVESDSLIGEARELVRRENAPKFCPNCGEPIDGTEPDALAFLGTDEEPVWDTCCYGCGWTGNIHPDWPVAGADRDAAR